MVGEHPAACQTKSWSAACVHTDIASRHRVWLLRERHTNLAGIALGGEGQAGVMDGVYLRIFCLGLRSGLSVA